MALQAPQDAGDMELVHVPAGSFVMGADDARDGQSARHIETMDHEYWIGRTPVTWKQYLAFCTATFRDAPKAPRWGIHDDHPVVNVSWSALHGPDGFLAWSGLALPTEAEWEKAARGTDGRQFPWGLLPPLSDEFATVGQSMDTGVGTSPVTRAVRGASPYGALDMAGNVWQWCEDEVAPHGPAAEPGRALKGGCWRNSAGLALSSFRSVATPDRAEDNMGFRVVLRRRTVGE